MKPQHTVKVSAGSRIYFFDVHADRNGTRYISVAELAKADNTRRRIVLYGEDFDKFRAALDQSVRFIESAENA